MSEDRQLDSIVDAILSGFDATNEVRDEALKQSRTLTRHCATAIRAVHRGDRAAAQRELVVATGEPLEPFPDLYHAGYTQDGLKEYADAHPVSALISDDALQSPAELGVEDASYLGGLGEAAGEPRRRVFGSDPGRTTAGRPSGFWAAWTRYTACRPRWTTRMPSPAACAASPTWYGDHRADPRRPDYKPSAVRAKAGAVGARRGGRLSPAS